VSRRQIEEWRSAQANELIAAKVTNTFIHAHPDHPIDIVLERLAETGGVLPVVSRTMVHRVEGVVTPETILPIRERSRPGNVAEPQSLPSAADATSG
jgi:hypothetical protein